jgi:hypothetical protein
MPRLLPELLKPHNSKNPVFSVRELRKRKPLNVPSELPPPPPRVYEKSILLHPDNPITNAWKYKYHKEPRPTPRAMRNVKRNSKPPSREMTDEERSWWSNPYCESPFIVL